MLTDRDLSRLIALQYVHGGEMRHIPHGVGASFDALEETGVVRIEREENAHGLEALSVHAVITDKGKRVAEAGMMAMREEIERG